MWADITLPWELERVLWAIDWLLGGSTLGAATLGDAAWCVSTLGDAYGCTLGSVAAGIGGSRGIGSGCLSWSRGVVVLVVFLLKMASKFSIASAVRYNCQVTYRLEWQL